MALLRETGQGLNLVARVLGLPIMRTLTAILVAAFVSIGVTLYLLSVAFPGGLEMGEDPLVGRWAVTEEESTWEFLADGIIVVSVGPDSLQGSWQRLRDDRLRIEFDTRGTYETIIAQVDLLEGENEAFVTVVGQTVRMQRILEVR